MSDRPHPGLTGRGSAAAPRALCPGGASAGDGGPDRGLSNFSESVVTEADLMDADDGNTQR
jgi:hypothetical protein